MNKRKLEYRLDRLCSVYTRCTEKRCFTCGKFLDYRKRQAGHYIPRIVKKTRWDTQNIHTQCGTCNVYLGGNLEEYRKRLPAEHRKYLDELYEDYKQGKLCSPTYNELVERYNSLLAFIRWAFPERAAPFEDWKKLEREK